MREKYTSFMVATCVWLLVGGFGSFAVAGEKGKGLKDLNCTTDQIPKFDGDLYGKDCAADVGNDTDTNSNAETECPEGHALLGDGSCVDIVTILRKLRQLLPDFEICAFEFLVTSGPFVDNCDGMITDTSTGLVWETKTDDGTIHDKDNLYSWSSTVSVFDGTASTVFLATLNTEPCFAGHCDWRLPEVGQDGGTAELETILDCSFGSPCIDPIFGPTDASSYWSANTYLDNRLGAWRVDFSNGDILFGGKTRNTHVRAVRTGP